MSLQDGPHFHCVYSEITVFTKNIIIVYLWLETRTFLEVIWQEQTKSSPFKWSSEAYRLFVWILMLIAISCEFENVRVIAVLKTKKHVLTISKKPMFLSPCLCAKAAKSPSVLVLNYKNSIFIVTTVCEKCDETAAIFIHLIDSSPVAAPVERRQTSDEVRYLKIT